MVPFSASVQIPCQGQGHNHGSNISLFYTNLQTAEANFNKLYRKVKHNEKVSLLKMYAPTPRVKVTVRDQSHILSPRPGKTTKTTEVNMIRLHKVQGKQNDKL